MANPEVLLASANTLLTENKVLLTDNNSLRTSGNTLLGSVRQNVRLDPQETVIRAGRMGTSSVYTIQKHKRVSVMIEETLNTPGTTGGAIIMWSDSEAGRFTAAVATSAFTQRLDADGSTSLGHWWTSGATDVIAKYMKVSIKNGERSASHTYNINVNLQH